MTKNRLEAFSDGVLAIIITITVLELGQPKGDKLGDLAELMPIILSYLLSFFFIATYWINHHNTLHDVEKVNYKILWLNIIWLFIMSFIPFLTAWVGSHPTSFLPLSLYFGDMALACIAFHFMYYFIQKENGAKFKLDLRSILSLIIYSLAAMLGGFCPIVAFIAVALISLWWAFPIKEKNSTK